MAFVLVAFMVLFILGALVFMAIKSTQLKDSATSIREEQAMAAVRRLSGTPEFAWTSDTCSQCVDADKALMIKEEKAYQSFWNNVPFLQFQFITTNSTAECTLQTYPACSTITLINGTGDFRTQDSFVALCRYDGSIGRKRCELGRISMGVASA